jgi:hypothetical protein
MPPFNSPEQKAVTATAPDDIWTPEQMGKFLDHVAAHRLGGCFALTPLACAARSWRATLVGHRP